MINFKPVFIREEIIRAARKFFYEQNFHEVIVPVLNKTVPHEPNLYPFSTGEYFLSLSPERGLKRMLSRGMGNCFAFAKSFRNLEKSGSWHIPEFLMLEWYRHDADYLSIMKDTKQLILSIQSTLGKESQIIKSTQHSWEIVSLQDVFKRNMGVSLMEVLKQESVLFDIARKKNYKTNHATWRGLWDQVFVNDIEQNLPSGPVFLTDYPAILSPLCKPQQDKPYLAERFELYIDKIEIANGNTENTDVSSMRKVFEKEKQQRGSSSQPIDEEFLAASQALQKGSYAGCGLGIDRLAMLFSGADSICDVEQLWEVKV